MGFLDDLKRLLRREGADARAWVDDAVAGGDAALGRAERRISADPDERLAATLEDIEAGEDAFAEIRGKADAASARPAAEAEVVAVERDEHDAPDPGGPAAP